MKILHCVESYYPSVGGMQEVVKQLSERLAALGHDVTVATRKIPERDFSVLNAVKVESFDITGNLVRGMEGETERYVNYLLDSDFDVITFFAAQQWATDLALPVLSKIKAKKVSVPTGYSGFYWPEYQQYFEDMKRWIREYDMNVYLSDDYRDINFARSNNVSRICIIPNGAGADEFLAADNHDIRKELAVGKDEFLVLHVGSFTGWKGHTEAISMFYASTIGKGTLLMIGNNFEQYKKRFFRNPANLIRYAWQRAKGKRLVFGYYSREFTVSAFRQSDLFLFPSNIECSPIVLFECAAARLPFLSTDVGNAAEIARWTGGGLILPTRHTSDGFSHAEIAASAGMLSDLYGDREKREQLGNKAFGAWRERFSWEIITRQYEKLYQALVES